MDVESLINRQICPVCKGKLACKAEWRRNWSYRFDCKSCGKFGITRTLLEEDFKITSGCYNLPHLASFLCYNQSKGLTRMLGEAAPQEGVRFISFEEVENWYPKTFSEKIDSILNFFGRDSKNIGHRLCYDLGVLKQILFIEDEPNEENEEGIIRQFAYWFDYLLTEGLIVEEINERTSAIVQELRTLPFSLFGSEETLSDEVIQFVLTPKAWERIYSIQKTDDNNKDVFVSMSFDKKNNPTREAIRQGIVKAGFSPEFLDEIIHNEQIVPKMFRLIRECRFLILEVSDPNYGAYYEAGYATGLGKEIIICCSEEVFHTESPHFDIAQKQILIWKDYEDLTKKLSEWIRALID